MSDSDILKRAKKADIDLMAITDWGKTKDLFGELIAEVERLRSFRGRIARILGQSPSDCDDLLIVGLDSRIILAKRLTARIKELQDLIDKPPEEADWVADYHLLQSALDGPIIDAARKWHAAYRKAQNSNLMRAKEVERLRAALAHELDLRNRHIESLEARIKELEATKERLQSAPKSGLYGKYIIQKADGSPVDPEADYFILRLDADPVARIAALEYAIQTDDQKLGEMLEKRVMDHVFSKDDQCRKRVEGWPIGQIKQLREQIASKDARIKELEAAVVDGRAQYLLFLDCNPDCTAWNFDELLEEDQNTLRRQARIILEMEEPWAYVQLREAREQIKLLEAAFLDSLAARLYYEHYPGVSDAYSWHDYPEEACHSMPKEKFREKAREALERIRSGKDEN